MESAVGNVAAISQDAAIVLAEPLKALADATRLRMLSSIAADSRGEISVQELVELTALSQPTVSHHLRVMREAGLLESRRSGTSVLYRITRARERSLMLLIDTLSPTNVPTSSMLIDAGPVSPGLDAEVSQLAEQLAGEFSGLSRDLVFSIVRESTAGFLQWAQPSEQILARTEQFTRERLLGLAEPARDEAQASLQVLFVCSSNAGRSQLAAALLHQVSHGRVVARSAGLSPAADLQPAVRTALTSIVGINDAAKMFPKPLTDDAVRTADLVVTFGCASACPRIEGVRYEDWRVGDPAIASPSGMDAIRGDIAARVETLLENGLAPIR